MRLTTTRQISLLVCLAVAGSCRSAPGNPQEVATSFVHALNSKDAGSMAKLSGIPFRFTNQAWKSASDGSGVVPGTATVRVATNGDELQALLRDVASNVTVSNPVAVANPPSKSDLLNEPLGGAAQWAGLELVLFKRGEGDVEHIAIVGVDGGSGKATGLFVN
jgi:hypothetical protein